MDDQSAKKPVTDRANQSHAVPDDQMADPNDLVYVSSYSEDKGSISDDPREIINNPAVAPQMLDTTTENLRDDLFKDPPAS